jgi:predicted O-methyltransferase YrrM
MTPKDIADYHVWIQSTYLPLLAARAQTMYQTLLLAVARNVRTIVETGTARQPNNWGGDGQSTVVFGAWCQRYGGRMWTCDLSEQAIAASRQVSASVKDRIEYVVSDSVEFLRNFKEPIDLLYLDSYDFPLDGSDHNPSQDHAVREAHAALPHLHNQSIILVDDCGLPHGGKGGKVVPFLMGEGWQVIGLGYQILLTRVLPMRT